MPCHVSITTSRNGVQAIPIWPSPMKPYVVWVEGKLEKHLRQTNLPLKYAEYLCGIATRVLVDRISWASDCGREVGDLVSDYDRSSDAKPSGGDGVGDQMVDESST
jgi:hypothetical protein